MGFGLAVRKELYRRKGAIASAAVRHPGPKLSARDHQELDEWWRGWPSSSHRGAERWTSA